MFKLKTQETLLLAAVLGLLALALFGPVITQPAHQHAFADQRVWAGIPFAMDVLSNLTFLAWALAGLTCLFGLFKHITMNAEHALARLFFSGLALTAAASSWYHFQPSDPGLGVDRLGMAVAFAGLLGLAVAGRVSHRAGVWMATAVLLLGPLSIWFWLASGIWQRLALAGDSIWRYGVDRLDGDEQALVGGTGRAVGHCHGHLYGGQTA